MYKVVKGDTLFSLSRRFGMSVQELRTLNALRSDLLSIGQTLKVFGSVSPPIVTPPPTPPPSVPSSPTTPTSAFSQIITARNNIALSIRQDTDCQRFTLTLPNPQGGQIRAQMRNNMTMSRYMTYPEGIFYQGQSQIELSLELIQAVGLTSIQARALQFVAQHEGNFDSINSYDRGIFSYGFIQFVGAAAHGASLNRLLAAMKTQQPALFRQHFQTFGIDSDGTQTRVFDNNTWLTGDTAWLFIQKNPRLYAPFITAGFEPLLVREQLRIATQLYVNVAINLRIPLIINNIPLTVPRISDILKSEAAMTMLIDICVNQGQGGLTKILQTAMPPIAQAQRLLTLPNLQRIDEFALLNSIATNATDERVRTRVRNIVNSGLSFDKLV